MKDYLHVTFSNGFTYQIPVKVIVEHRSKTLHETNADEFPTLAEAMTDTEDLFASDTYEIEDWAKNNMNWTDVNSEAVLVDVTQIDLEQEWISAAVEISAEKLKISELLKSKKPFLSLPMEFLISYMDEKDLPISIFSLSANQDEVMGAVVSIVGPNTDFFIAAIKHANNIIYGANEKPANETAH